MTGGRSRVKLLVVARGSSDGERTIDGHQTMCTVALELGQIDRARAEIQLARHVAAELRQPTHVFALRTYEKVLALLDGRFEVAEAMLVADAAPPDINSARDNESTDAVHLFFIRREQGRSAEVEQQVRDAAAGAPWYPYLRAVLGCVLVDQGRVDEAREVLQRLARDQFRDLYPDSQWLAGACLAAELCGAVGHAATAEELHRQLSPFAGRHAIAHAEGSLGSVDRYLGLLAAATGRLDVAVAHFDDALAMDDRLGARPWAAHDLADRAMVLRSRALPVDLAAAGEDERHARDLAAELGMVALLHRLG